jgi:hypothetical protein
VRLRPDGRVLLLTVNNTTQLTQLSPDGQLEWSRSYQAPSGILHGRELIVLPDEAGYAISGTVVNGGSDKGSCCLRIQRA